MNYQVNWVAVAVVGLIYAAVMKIINDVEVEVSDGKNDNPG